MIHFLRVFGLTWSWCSLSLFFSQSSFYDIFTISDPASWAVTICERFSGFGFLKDFGMFLWCFSGRLRALMVGLSMWQTYFGLLGLSAMLRKHYLLQSLTHFTRQSLVSGALAFFLIVFFRASGRLPMQFAI